MICTECNFWDGKKCVDSKSFENKNGDFVCRYQSGAVEIENKKLGQEPAFSQAAFYHPDCGPIAPEYGMSKRFYAACLAMQGILSGANEKLIYTSDQRCDAVAEVAYQYADALLKYEDK